MACSERSGLPPIFRSWRTCAICTLLIPEPTLLPATPPGTTRLQPGIFLLPCHAGAWRSCARKGAWSGGWKSLLGRRSPAHRRPQLRRREAGWRAGEVEPSVRRMTNPIRHEISASFRATGEASTPRNAGKPIEPRGSVSRLRWGDPCSWGRNDGKAGHLNRGDPAGWETPPGVRAAIVVLKRGNACGAKGGRKVDT